MILTLHEAQAVAFAAMKSSVEGGAPVYNYLFKWSAPHLDGMIKSMHCQEIAFVFNSIARNEQYSGGTPEAYALADKMSRAWASFARTGNPNTEGLPEWVPFKGAEGAAMIFDNVSELRYNHDKELLEVVAAIQ
jgi:para-nitrobenzyl esterase